jgi:two-component system sensor histidine kinase AtoS
MPLDDESSPAAPAFEFESEPASANRSPRHRRPYMRFSPVRLRLRLRIAIPALLVIVALSLATGFYSLIEYHSEESRSPKEALQEIRAQVPILTVVACVFALLVGFGIVYYLIRPLERLRESIESVSRGDFSRRLSLGPARDEIGRMGQSYDQMIEALNDLFSKRNRLIFDNKLQAIVVLGPDGIILGSNDGATSLFGGSRSPVGRNLFRLLDAQPGNEPLIESLREALDTGRQLSARQHLLVDAESEAQAIVVSATSLRGENGRRAGMAATFQNLAGLRDFYARINRSDRLAAVGTLAMGLAHEIRNPLGAIKGLVQILVQSAAKGSDTERYGSVIIQEVNRLDNLLTELLEFSQPAELRVESARLLDLLQAVETTARMKVEGKTKRDLQPAEIVVEGDRPFLMPREKVYQALLNIVLNAFEAAAAGEGTVSLRASFRPGGVNIEVENTGSTIPPENLDKIFQPFFTTKEDGTGLGLALTYQILTYVGGQIDAQSEENLVRFVIDLPEASADLDSAASMDSSAPGVAAAAALRAESAGDGA